MYSLRIASVHRRSFVSTVLLSRTWDNETVVQLRKEAKSRGLSTKGNKSTLISRIQEYEQNTVTATHTPPATRKASTTTTPSQKTCQAASPGIPLASQTHNTSTRSDFFDVKLPDLFQPPPNTPVQVPYLPDFWNSAQPKAPLEPELPKLHVVGGSATHYDGGPMYNLEKHHEGDSPSPTVQPATNEVGLRADFWESLGFPRSFSARRPLSNLTAQAGKDKFQSHSRPLTDEERKGLYILLGIVGGSWSVGALVNRSTSA